MIFILGAPMSCLYKTVILLAESFDKTIIIAGLDGDFFRKPFQQMCDLIPYSDKVDKLSAICKNEGCDSDACFSFRLNQKDFMKEVVGGYNMYMPLCMACIVVHFTEVR